jgi:adenylate cyclase
MELDPDDALAAGMAAWGHAQLVLQNASAAVAADKAAAVRLSTRAGILDDDDPVVLTARGLVHTATDEFDAATILIDRALARDPNSPWALERRGWLYMYAGEPEPAMRYFTRAIRLDLPGAANATRLIGIGCAHFDLGRYDLTAQWMRRALVEHPGTAWVNRSLSVAYARIGERPLADHALNSFRRDRPDVTIADVTSALRFRPDFVERIAAGLDDLGLPPG